MIESEGDTEDENAQLDLDAVGDEVGEEGREGPQRQGEGRHGRRAAATVPDAPPEEGVEKIKGHNYFIATVTRPPKVYRGNPFQVEVGLAYGGSWPPDKTIELFRFANRVPLLFQRGACGITDAIVRTDWRNYLLSQPKGSLPVGPMALLVHIASVWVPFTSESKEAVAHYPEITKEIQLAAQECGRKLATFIRKRKAADYQAQRRSIFELYIEEVAAAIGRITGQEAGADQEGVPGGGAQGDGGGDEGRAEGAGARGARGEAEGRGAPRGRGVAMASARRSRSREAGVRAARPGPRKPRDARRSGGEAARRRERGHAAQAQGRALEEDGDQDREARRERAAHGGQGEEPLPRDPGALARQRQLEREEAAGRARRPEAEALLLQRRDGAQVHADVPRQRGVQGADRRRQDDQHPRPLLHDEAHDRRHAPEHLRGAGRVRPDHRGPRGHARLAARGAAPVRRAQGLDGRADHHHRHRRHDRPAAHGLGRLGGALDRRGERDRLPQARGEVRPADREGRRLGALQRGQVLEAQQLHHRAGRRPAAARRAPAGAAAAHAS